MSLANLSSVREKNTPHILLTNAQPFIHIFGLFLKDFRPFHLFKKKSLYYKELADERHHSVRLTQPFKQALAQTPSICISTNVQLEWSFWSCGVSLWISCYQLHFYVLTHHKEKKPTPIHDSVKLEKKNQLYIFPMTRVIYLMKYYLSVSLTTYTHMFVYMHTLKSIYETEHVFFLRLGVLA